MGTLLNAFGMYASERASSYQYIPIGIEGYENEGIINFLQGRYYVKLAAFGDGTKPVLEQFARSLSANIGEKGTLPAVLQQLPQTHLRSRSEQYLTKSPLGHDFLAPGKPEKHVTGIRRC